MGTAGMSAFLLAGLGFLILGALRLLAETFWAAGVAAGAAAAWTGGTIAATSLMAGARA